jgi:capsule polysaccharide modification protein KpsS
MASDNKQYATTQEAEADNPRTQNLSAEEKIRYNMMDDIEKKQFINYGRADLRNALQYLARWKEAKAETERQYKLQQKQT